MLGLFGLTVLMSIAFGGLPPQLHTWCWTPVANALHYELLSAEPGSEWIELATAEHFDTEQNCTFTPVEDPPGELVMFVVVSCNDYGCSSTQHGDFPGEGISADDDFWLIN